jgi:hypothetical protein
VGSESPAMASTASSDSLWSQEQDQCPGWLTAHVVDPAVRRITSFSVGAAGSLIHEVHRRRRRDPRRTPGNLLLEDACGCLGPALVDLVTDPATQSVPPDLGPGQAKDLALAAGKAVLDGGVDRMLEIGRESLRQIPWAIGGGRRRRPTPADRDQTSESSELLAKRGAWRRFLAAYLALDERRAAFLSSPSDLTAEQVRWAEMELEDAVAVAGEFQVHDLRWSLT